jgi:membrane associated rhomboid family serine protease
MSTLQDLKYKYSTLDVFGKLIVINIFVFVIGILLKVLKLGVIMSFLSLPSGFWDFIIQPWSIVTYGFLHTNLFHLLFNMLMLFYLSRVAVNIFRDKQVLNVFFLGIIAGGALYVGIANLWPTDFFGARGILVGASAGVSALLLFVGAYMPNSEIRLFNMFTVKWKHIAVFFVTLDVIRLLLGINQGGYIAHIGGYTLGYFYAVQLLKGNDIGSGFERLMGRFLNVFKPKTNLKTVHRKSTNSTHTKSTKSTNSESQATDSQKQIDAILDKISKSGYDSLTTKEKAFLFKAGK